MRFDRYPFRPSGHRPSRVPPQLRPAAQRAVDRELAKVPLFPELARFRTVEEREEIQAREHATYARQLRTFRATKWHEARAELAALPAVTAAGVRTLWQAAWYPGDPVYLLGVIRNAKAGHSAWTTLREAAQFNRRRARLA